MVRISTPQAVRRNPASQRRSWRAWLSRFIVLGLSLAVAAVLAEAAVRVIRPQDMSGRWRQRDSLGLRVHRRDCEVQHQLGDRTVRYQFDQHGLRRMTADEGALRILCLGDSFTFGWLLEPSDTYLGLLQAQADEQFGAGEVVLLNAAHCGWGLSDHVDYLERYADEHCPDAVVVFVSADDLGRSLRNPSFEIVDRQTLQLRRTPPEAASKLDKIAASLPIYDWLLVNSHLFQLVRSAILSPRFKAQRQQLKAEQTPVLEGSTPFPPERVTALGRALFRRMQDWCQANDCELLVLTTGFHHQRGTPSLDDPEPTRAFMAHAEQILAEENIAFYDCSPVLHERVNRSYRDYVMPLDGHPNEQGSALIAELNWPRLQEFIEQLQRERAPHDVSAGP